MTEARRWPRIQLALDVKVRFETLDRALEARTLNVSREGVFILMDRPRPIGTRVRMSLRVEATGESFFLEGVVVRCVPDGDEQLKSGDERGIAVFLTSSSSGYSHFCDLVAQHRSEQTRLAAEFTETPTEPLLEGDIIEAVRKAP